MKRSPFSGVVSLGAALALMAPVAARAQTPGGQYFVVHQEVAKPSMVKEYESTSKEFVAMVKANKAKMPHFSFNCLASPDFTYTFVAPIPNMAGMDAINGDFGALAQSAGASFADLNKRSGAATEYIKEWIIQLVPELSYSPAEPRAGAPRYFHYGIYYVMPGREAEAEALGAEMPAYIVSVGAADAAEYQADDAKLAALLGTEFQALGARTIALTRRFETREATARPDLSVPR